ncbi:MAG: hypothetical protein M3077_13595 [Candidatus Dormibacteraeota bacterium]|nr:hypothetical protein [Candidatus Dormibacteraeota bacterium]
MAGDKRAELAAEGAVDIDRLLPGEHPDTQYPDDAKHWLTVYTELVQGKMAMLAAIHQALASMQEPVARQEIESTDLIVMKRELKRFESRIEFWAKRNAEFEAAGPS